MLFIINLIYIYYDKHFWSGKKKKKNCNKRDGHIFYIGAPAAVRYITRALIYNFIAQKTNKQKNSRCSIKLYDASKSDL